MSNTMNIGIFLKYKKLLNPKKTKCHKKEVILLGSEHSLFTHSNINMEEWEEKKTCELLLKK